MGHEEGNDPLKSSRMRAGNELGVIPGEQKGCSVSTAHSPLPVSWDWQKQAAFPWMCLGVIWQAGQKNLNDDQPTRTHRRLPWQCHQAGFAWTYSGGCKRLLLFFLHWCPHPSRSLESTELEQLVYLEWNRIHGMQLSGAWCKAKRAGEGGEGRYFILESSFVVVENIFVLWHKLEQLRAGWGLKWFLSECVGNGLDRAGVQAAPQELTIKMQSRPERVRRAGSVGVTCRKPAIVAHYRSSKMRK